MIFRLYDMFHMFDMVSLHTQWYKERDIPDPNFKKLRIRILNLINKYFTHINQYFEFNPQIFYTLVSLCKDSQKEEIYKKKENVK